MNKLIYLLILLIFILTGCSSETIEVNGQTINKSEYTNESLEYTSTYSVIDETTDSVTYNITVHIYNAKLKETNPHIDSIMVTDFAGNEYVPEANSVTTTVDYIAATDSVDLDFDIKMPKGQKPCDIYFFDENGNFVDTVTYNYDDK